MKLLLRIALVVIFGALLYWTCFYSLPEYWIDPTGWPSTTGTIIKSHHTGKHLFLRYTYSVEGKTYEGDKCTIGRKRIMYLGFHSEYPVGTPIQVFYDPKNPELAVLQNVRLGWLDIIPRIICGLFASFGVLAGLFGKVAGPISVKTYCFGVSNRRSMGIEEIQE